MSFATDKNSICRIQETCSIGSCNRICFQGIGYINEILPYIPTKNQKELYYMPEFQENGVIHAFVGRRKILQEK